MSNKTKLELIEVKLMELAIALDDANIAAFVSLSDSGGNIMAFSNVESNPHMKQHIIDTLTKTIEGIRRSDPDAISSWGALDKGSLH